MMMLSPEAANFSAMAFPNPEVAPVTSTFLFMMKNYLYAEDRYPLK
jgi:hypothetical protein